MLKLIVERRHGKEEVMRTDRLPKGGWHVINDKSDKYSKVVAFINREYFRCFPLDAGVHFGIDSRGHVDFWSNRDNFEYGSTRLTLNQFIELTEGSINKPFNFC